MPNCRWPFLISFSSTLLKWRMSTSTVSVASLHIAGAHPRPLARVCDRHSPWPKSVTCRARGSCRVNQMKNVCNMLNLRIVDCRKCSCYVACCEKWGLQISWKCVAEVSPKCCALIHKGIYWLKWKLKVYIWHKTFSLIHTYAKWYRENRRSKWYIQNNMPDAIMTCYAKLG